MSPAPSQPLGAQVPLRVLEEETMTRSTSYLPDTDREQPRRGEVAG